MTVETLGRAVQTYRRTAGSRSAVLLIVANLIPLIGVLFFGWSLWTILVLYWVENGIVGFWNVPKLLLAQGPVLPTVMPPMPEQAARAASAGDPARASSLRARWEEMREAQQRAIDAAATAGSTTDATAGSTTDATAGSTTDATAAAPGPSPAFGRVRVFGQPMGESGGRVGLAIFFLMHYGIFWFVHGIFIFTLPMFFGGGGLGGAGACESLGPGDFTFGPDGLPIPVDVVSSCGGFGSVVWGSVLIGAIALFISHGASFLLNYVGRGEYLTTSAMRQTAAPYGRVVILHLTILFGAFAVAALGAPIAALLILVSLKTAVDLTLHLRARRTADARIPVDTADGQAIRGG